MENTKKSLYKTETHLHTEESSFCGMLTARQMVELYHKRGYSTVFITDHLTKLTFEKYSQDSWVESVDRYLRGYREATRAAEGLGVNVILGAEITLTESPNDYLLYGVTREFLIEHPEIYTLTREALYREAKKAGILVIQAHPHRDGVCYPTLDTIDGLEVYNSNPRHDDRSDKTRELAHRHGLYMTAGSDAHREDDACLSGVLTDTEIKTSADLIEAIKNGKIDLIIPQNVN